MKRIRYWIATNINGSKCEDVLEIDDADWENMTEDAREEMMQDAAFQYLDWGWEVQE